MAVIYGVVHEESGKAYVGSTACKPSKRFREHRCLLRNGKHTSHRLQTDWDIFGEPAFKFVVFHDLGHNVTHDVVKRAEQKWIDAKDAEGLLYNTYRGAYTMPRETTLKGVEAARHLVGNRWSPEANEKRRLAQIGRPKGHGAKISATKRAKRLALAS